MDSIVHFILRDEYDKFPVGYINFMKLRMAEYEHHFFIRTSDWTRTIHGHLNLCDDENVYYYDKQLPEVLRRRSLLRNCRKIIVSSPLQLEDGTEIFLLLSGLISKTYLHFWNSHFTPPKYFLRNIVHPRRTLRFICDTVKFMRKRLLVRKSAGIIGLIDGDVERLNIVFPGSPKQFVAPMMGDPLKKSDFSVRDKPKESTALRILVGHSAHDCSQPDVFRSLEHLKGENIEIICPLSYGEPWQREKVIKVGNEIFGDKFIPITALMSKQDYINFLASCDVGVLATNTQQGMGNISILLRLGKKVYIRNDTTMWPFFRHTMKYTVYPVSELEGITLESLMNFPPELAYNNIKIAEELSQGNYTVEKWRKVFED